MVGLCLSCRWSQRIHNRKGSTFHRCGRADFDPAFVKYPPLPVLRCPGFELPEAAGAEEQAEISPERDSTR